MCALDGAGGAADLAYASGKPVVKANMFEGGGQGWDKRLISCLLTAVVEGTVLVLPLRTAGGELYMMGQNWFGQLGLGEGLREDQNTPQLVTSPNGGAVTAISLGGFHSAFMAGTCSRGVILILWVCVCVSFCQFFYKGA